MRRSDTIIFPTDFVSIVTQITADSPLQVFHSDSFWILCSILTAWRPYLKGPFRLNSFFCRIVLLPYRTRGNAFVASVHQYILTKAPQGRNTSKKGGDGLGEILGCLDRISHQFVSVQDSFFREFQSRACFWFRVETVGRWSRPFNTEFKSGPRFR